jgi:ketosteroid isomerase-like protein
MADKSLTELIRIYFKAYETKDRSALESTLSHDFTFTSPYDDHIDRATYLERCWPKSKHTRAVHIRKLFDRGNEAFVLYNLEPDNLFATRNSSLEAAARSKRSKFISDQKSAESRTSNSSHRLNRSYPLSCRNPATAGRRRVTYHQSRITDHFLYCSSVTFSIHSTCVPFSAS